MCNVSYKCNGQNTHACLWNITFKGNDIKKDIVDIYQPNNVFISTKQERRDTWHSIVSNHIFTVVQMR